MSCPARFTGPGLQVSPLDGQGRSTPQMTAKGEADARYGSIAARDCEPGSAVAPRHATAPPCSGSGAPGQPHHPIPLERSTPRTKNTLGLHWPLFLMSHPSPTSSQADGPAAKPGAKLPMSAQTGPPVKSSDSAGQACQPALPRITRNVPHRTSPTGSRRRQRAR